MTDYMSVRNKEFQDYFNAQKIINKQILEQQKLQAEQLGQSFKPKVFDDEVLKNAVIVKLNKMKSIIAQILDSGEKVNNAFGENIDLVNLFNSILEDIASINLSPGMRSVIGNFLQSIVPNLQSILILYRNELADNNGEEYGHKELSKIAYEYAIISAIIKKIAQQTYKTPVTLQVIKDQFEALIKGQLNTGISRTDMENINMQISLALRDPNNILQPLLGMDVKPLRENHEPPQFRDEVFQENDEDDDDDDDEDDDDDDDENEENHPHHHYRAPRAPRENSTYGSDDGLQYY